MRGRRASSVAASGLTTESDHKEARFHVARWFGSQPQASRLSPARRGRRDGRGGRGTARRRRPSRPGRACLPASAAAAGGDRVDDRRPLRPRPARAARLGGRDRGRGEGEVDSRRLLARPTRSTPGCWPSSPVASSSRPSGCPTRRCGQSASAPASALHLVRHRSSLKQRIHATLLTHGKPCPVSDLFGVRGRELLARLGLPEPWASDVEASLRLIDELEREIEACERELRRLGAAHPYVPLLTTIPGIAWVLAYTIAAEIGDIARFGSPTKLAGYTGLCPRVYQSGESDRRGPLSKKGPRYLRWALVEATSHASKHPLYRERYQRTKSRLGKQRGPKVAQVDLARRLAEAIWHMLTRNRPFAPAGAPAPMTA